MLRSPAWLATVVRFGVRPVVAPLIATPCSPSAVPPPVPLIRSAPPSDRICVKPVRPAGTPALAAAVDKLPAEVICTPTLLFTPAPKVTAPAPAVPRMDTAASSSPGATVVLALIVLALIDAPRLKEPTKVPVERPNALASPTPLMVNVLAVMEALVTFEYVMLTPSLNCVATLLLLAEPCTSKLPLFTAMLEPCTTMPLLPVPLAVLPWMPVPKIVTSPAEVLLTREFWRISTPMLLSVPVPPEPVTVMLPVPLVMVPADAGNTAPVNGNGAEAAAAFWPMPTPILPPTPAGAGSVEATPSTAIAPAPLTTVELPARLKPNPLPPEPLPTPR